MQSDISNTYLITGATGYIGNSLIKRIMSEEENVKFLLPVRDMKKAEAMFTEEIAAHKEKFEFWETSVENFGGFFYKEPIDYLIHCASPTKSAYMVSHPVETTDSIVLGTRNVLELARRCHAKSVIYLSSMEVYGDIDCSDGRKISETELGDIELFNVRSCYPLAKRMAEHLCFSYYKEYGVPVKIARLAQTFGKGILPGENRVFAQFANAVRHKEDIVLHTAGNSMGNYCDIEEVLEAILLLLDKGQNGEVYNVVNEDNTMTIREMAELVAHEIAEDSIKVVYDIPKDNSYGYAADTGLRLSSKKLEKLGRSPKKSLKDMYCSMIQDMDRMEF